MMASRRDEPLYVTLYREWRDHILSGTLPAETKLPSIRQLSQTRQLSKTTVERAYHQLVIEGYVDGREKSGHYVVPLQAMLKDNVVHAGPQSDKHHYANLGQHADAFDLSALRKAYQHVHGAA
ncbi:MAG: GntR family transcriptional regulator, partial [Acholeplasmatales bacterium]